VNVAPAWSRIVSPGCALLIAAWRSPPAVTFHVLPEPPAAVVKDQTGRPREVWVRWSRVPDFHGSGARDRHYVIDYLTGEIRFGDGLSGMIPPVGSGNIRLARYKNGGGASGLATGVASCARRTPDARMAKTNERRVYMTTSHCRL